MHPLLQENGAAQMRSGPFITCTVMFKLQERPQHLWFDEAQQ